jgi:nucleoside-diphosphate-sugar epimerase
VFIGELLDKTPAEHIFNVGNCETVSIWEWVAKCFNVLGKTPELIKVSSDITARTYFPFRDYEYVLDVTRQNAILKPSIALEDGLSESYLWYKYHSTEVLKKDYFSVISELIAK